MSSESFYQGKIYSMDPKPIFSHYIQGISSLQYPVSAGGISTSLDARTANQIKEVSEMLNTGIKNIEIAGHSPGVFEAIPQEHLRELNRMAKLNKVDFSLHAPMIDATGITPQGWDRMTQKNAQEQMWNAVERGHDLDPNGNIIVNFHASTTEIPGAVTLMKEGGKEKKVAEVFINTTDGKMAQLKEELSYYEGEGAKAKMLTPEERIEKYNKENWTKQITNLNYYTDLSEGRIQNGYKILGQAEGIVSDPEKKQELIKEGKKELMHGKYYLKDCARSMEEFYNDVFKNASKEEQKQLMTIRDNLKSYEKKFDTLESNPKEMENFKAIIENGLQVMGEMKPKIFESIRDFAVEKSAETFANIALKGYDKFGSTAPVIVIENHPAQQSLLTTGQDIRDVVDKARELFIKKAIEDGMSESQAKKQAEKLIGATWDVGHINMLRKFGYTEKDIVKETEKVAPVVKHIHLSDNFGYEHTELPMGMGNVPIKDIMEKLGKQGFESKKVVEALSWWQHFSQGGKTNPPFVPTMQAFGSQLYSGAPSWNQIYGIPGGYFSGYGTMLPEQHFQIYGAGFTALPGELGGQIQNKDKFSGTPLN